MILLAAWAAPGMSAESPLTSIAAIKGLSVERASKRLPVQLRAVVTSFNPAVGDLFVQDHTGAVYLGPSASVPQVALGDEVEVEGVTNPGGFCPIVSPERIRRLGPKGLPACQEATAQMLMEPYWDARRVEIEGVVGRVTRLQGAWRIDVYVSDGPVAVILYDRTEAQLPANWMGARVRFTGVSSPIYTSDRQVVRARLHVVPQQEFRVLPSGRVDFTALPVTPMQQILRPEATSAERSLTRIQGTLTAVLSSGAFYLQDESGGLLVRSVVPLTNSPGTRLELLGFPRVEAGAVLFGLAEHREQARGELPPPVALTSALLASGQHYQRRVTFEASVLTVTPAVASGIAEVVLDFGSAILLTRVREEHVNLQNLVSGCRVRVCGVLAQQAKADPSAAGLNVHLTRADDLRIVAGPPPNPTRMLLAALAMIGGLGGLALSWSLTLRHRVRARTAELAASQQEIKVGREMLRLILDSAAEAIYGVDAHGYCTFCNRACLEILGYDGPDELVGKSIHGRVHRRHAEGACFPQPACPISKALQLGLGTHLDDEVLWRKDGSSFPAEFWSYPQWQDGRIVGAVVTFIDITERKLAEEQKLKMERRLLQAQKLESLGSLAGGLAHDMNNVLAPILTVTKLLQSGRPGVDAQGMLSVAQSGVERGMRMVQQLMALAGGNDAPHAAVHLGAILGDVRDFLARDLPASITVEFCVPGDLGPVRGNATQLWQVLANLCGNARDAMPHGGRLTISAVHQDLTASEAATFRGAIPRRYVAISVADTGIGMPPDVQQRLFESFFTTKRSGKGTGLGLFTSQRIVHQHQGFIHVASEVGAGSRFTVFLPIDSAAGASTAESAVPSPALPTAPPSRKGFAGQRILVVDDEPNVRITCQALLESMGFRVLTAGDGEEALRVYQAHQADIHAVILDMMMPKMDGLATLQELRARQSRVPVIACSGLPTPQRVAAAKDNGATLFLPKPYTDEQLSAALQAVLECAR